MHHFDAHHPDWRFAVCQGTTAAVLMPGQAFGISGTPGHGTDISGCGNRQVRGHIQIQRGIRVSVDRNGFDLCDRRAVSNVKIGSCSAVGIRSAWMSANADIAAHEIVCRLCSRQQHAPHTRFRCRNRILRRKSRTAFKDAAVLEIKMAELPHVQDVDSVRIVPEPLIGVKCLCARVAGTCTFADIRLLANTGAQLAVTVIATRERWMPGQIALCIVRCDITGIRHISAGLCKPPGLVHIPAVCPRPEPQRRRKGVNRCQITGEVKRRVHALNSQNVHRSVRQGKRVCAHIPAADQALVRPVCHRCCGIRAKLCSAQSCQIVKRRHGCCAVSGLRIHRSKGILQILAGRGHHARETAEPRILRISAVIAERPPLPENIRGVGAVQHCRINRVQLHVALIACNDFQRTGHSCERLVQCGRLHDLVKRHFIPPRRM